MKRYWLHRISHESKASYPLLEQGFLSIGFSDFGREDFFDVLLEKDDKNSWKFFEDYIERNGGRFRNRYILWRFLCEFNLGDTVLIPTYKAFSLYEVAGSPILAKNLDKRDIRNDNQFRISENGLVHNDKVIDIGFLIPVKLIEKDIPRNEYADTLLTSRMKMRQTNGEITELKESVENALENFIKGSPELLYGSVIEKMKESLLNKINTILNPSEFEKLVQWYMDKIGADSTYIPPKNNKNKCDEADADVVADFNLLKIRVLVQVKHHTELTGKWAIHQIDKYFEQDQTQGDADSTYISWVLSSASGFTEEAVELSIQRNVRLINGLDFAEMLIEAGLDNIDQAFVSKRSI